VKVVVDASVVVKWLLPDPAAEEGVDDAVAVLEEIKNGTLDPIQPPHWLAEAAAVITRLHPEIAQSCVELLHAMEIPVQAELTTYTRSVALGADLSHHVFDTLYHAVALEKEATLVSADDRYVRKARYLGSLSPLKTFVASRSSEDAEAKPGDADSE
jgi:predicted nucleic acid-binding protein